MQLLSDVLYLTVKGCFTLIILHFSSNSYVIKETSFYRGDTLRALRALDYSINLFLVSYCFGNVKCFVVALQGLIF